MYSTFVHKLLQLTSHCSRSDPNIYDTRTLAKLQRMCITSSVTCKKNKFHNVGTAVAPPLHAPGVEPSPCAIHIPAR